MKTGFEELDKKIDINNKLVIVGGRPAMGKTTIGLNIATNVAVRQRIPTLIFSLENSKEQIINRIASSECMIERLKIERNNLENGDLEKVSKVFKELAKTEIFIDDTPAPTIEDIEQKVKQMKKEKNVELVVIDYLQLIQINEKCRTREQEYASIFYTLKILARKLNLTIIITVELPRDIDKRDNKKPVEKDYRYFGSLEQDADIIISMYRDDVYDKDSEELSILELNVTKSRDGDCGKVKLVALDPYCIFVDLVKKY